MGEPTFKVSTSGDTRTLEFPLTLDFEDVTVVAKALDRSLARA